VRFPNLAAAVTFAGLTALLTYPQVREFATSVPYHSDPYFSMWRLAWIAHAIRNAPRQVFDANIFYPEQLTLAYSDAILLPGIVLAPLFWAGTSPVITYNVALFSAFTLSGLTAFSLARLVTGDVRASLVAGVIYAFAPYRFTHYMHLELQLVFWIPPLLFIIHRSLPVATVRDGVLFGAVLGCQLLSCIYAGIFAAMFCVVFVPCLTVIGGRRWRYSLKPLMAAVATTVLLALPYAYAYVGARDTVGTRSIEQFRLYSASLENYLSAPQMNRLYGSTAITDPMLADEMNLFPGVVTVLLALAGVFGSQSRSRYAYVVGLIVAIVMTAGVNGVLYGWLFEHVPLFRALRSPARFEILVLLCLAVLSAYGMAAVLDRIGSAKRRVEVTAAVVMLLMTEFASAPRIAPVPAPSKVDAYLARKPASVIVELPLISDKGMWGSLDWLYMYQGLPHFRKMLNGYSGYAPASFYQMRELMSGFPDDRSIAFLRRLQVDYVVIRTGLYGVTEAATLLERVRQREELSLEVMFTPGSAGGEALFKVIP
jgi:hypothetical protein